MKYLVILGMSIVLIFACNPSMDSKGYIVEAKIYTVKKSDGSFEKDALQYLEKEYFDHNNQLLKKEYYDSTIQLKGTESYIYLDGENSYHKSQYEAPDSSILSYYTHEYNDLGNRTSSLAYSGATDEFLRKEQYEYNAANQRVTRKIIDENNNIQRRFEFSFDGYGNENSMTVYQADSTVLFKESYKITEYNEDKAWLKKWGFVNDEPTSYHEKSHIYF